MKTTLVKNKVTLGSIAESIKTLATKNDIYSINDKLSLIDKRFDAVDGKLFEFTEKFEKIEFKIDQMDKRFTNQLDYFDLWYPTRREFVGLDDRIKKIEKRLKT